MAGPISDIKINPEGEPNAKLWLIGDAPGFDDLRFQRPFIGASGQLLRETLRRHGKGMTASGTIAIDAQLVDVYVTYVCNYRPLDGDFSLLKDTWQLSDGILELKKAINEYKPNCIITLGDAALSTLCGKYGAYNHNASILPSLAQYGSTKVVACLSPNKVLGSEGDTPLFDFAIRRGVEQSEFADIRYEPRDIRIDPTQSDIEELFAAKELVVDIENIKHKTTIRCIAFSPRDSVGICFNYNQTNYKTIVDLLGSGIPLIFHNGVHDVTVNQLEGNVVTNYFDDTIIRAHILDPELPRSLAVLNYLYTTWPYYKTGGTEDNDIKGWSTKKSTEELLEYCAKDVISTRRIWSEQQSEFTPDLLNLHAQEMKVQRMAVALGHRGLLVDEERRSILSDLATKKIKFYLNQFWNLAKKEVNPGSPKQVCEFLYDDLGLPVRKNRKTGGRTSDEDALVSLLQHCSGKLLTLKTDKARQEWSIKLAILKVLLILREWLKVKSSYIDITLHDGKAKSTWKVPGTETGRWSAANFCDSSGLNLQTLPRGGIESE